MAIANLHETLLSYTLRKSQLEYEIGVLQDRKMLAAYSVGDLQSALSHEKKNAIEQFKAEWDENYEIWGEDFKLEYIDYTKLPDYQETIDRITAEFQEQIDEQTAYEGQLDNQLTVNSTELEEVNAYIDSLKSMLSSNVQDDFNFGLGQ